MKPYADFQNKMKFPQKRDFDTYFLYQRGVVIVNSGTLEVIEKTIRERENIAGGAGAVQVLADKYHYAIEKAHDKEKYDAAVIAFRAEDARLREEFMSQLFEECGVQDEPARVVMFDFAWQEGHSNGMTEVASIFNDIVTLIERVSDARKEAREDR